jgi:hypothetical protein
MVDFLALTELAQLSGSKKLVRAARAFTEMADANKYADL